MKLLWVSFCLCCASLIHAQSDILVLKEKERNIKFWTKGNPILFQFSNTQWITGYIKDIRNDSLLINQYITRQLPNQFGVFSLDTMWLGLLQLHVNEIRGMPSARRGSSVFTNGALLQTGSGAYVLINMFNSLYRGDAVFGKDNLPGLGIAAGVFLLGKLQQWRHKDFLLLGKKYRLEIISGAPK